MGKKLGWILVILLVVGVLVWLAVKPGTANLRWFGDQSYNFGVLRTLGEGAFDGADAGEVLAAIRGVREGDDEGWYQGWYDMARQVEDRANRVNNSISRGKGLLRAANYYRTAEFFLDPQDSRRLPAFNKSVETFYRGLEDLGIRYEVLTVPYGEHTLQAVFYPGGPGADGKPLLVAHGGYDSTQEEVYFFVVAAALERGYSCLTFTGPGQGTAIREQGLRFTPEWEKPTGAVLDAYIEKHGRPGHIVLLGLSLGGYLAPRAAAYDSRIDGVVAHNVCFDFQEAALRQVPGVVKWLYGRGYLGLVNTMMKAAMKFKPGVRWGVRNAKWTMGAKDPVDLLRIFNDYNLRDEAGLITCDVLITAGAKDHFFPVEQVAEFQKALTKARSVTTRVFTEEEGGAEHCQTGALNMFHETLFDWMESRFKPVS